MAQSSEQEDQVYFFKAREANQKACIERKKIFSKQIKEVPMYQLNIKIFLLKNSEVADRESFTF